jgi:predicted flap endonuclease-1-like 5' DNA nuclease
MSIPCYLIPALVGLISGILGYLIGKMSSNNNVSVGGDNNWQADLDNCNRKNLNLQAEFDKLKANVNTTASNFVSGGATAAASVASITFDASAAKEALGKSVKENDLKIVEGIGPKIEELFNTSGILTWKALSETSVDRLREILNKAGERFQIHDPGTWPSQSKLAYEGKWKELKDWQDSLDGGRES